MAKKNEVYTILTEEENNEIISGIKSLLVSRDEQINELMLENESLNEFISDIALELRLIRKTHSQPLPDLDGTRST